MKRVLFICSQNLCRSPTAERVFSGRQGLEVTSAGFASDAPNVVSAKLIQWADLIFVMEPYHCSRLAREFQLHLAGKRVICLDIPDVYPFMDPALVDLLKEKVDPYLT